MKTRKTSKITKPQLVRKLAEETSISQVQCDFMVETLFDIVRDLLLAENEVEFKYLGKFYFYQHGSKPSNMTGQIVPPHRQLKFKPSDQLARTIRVNSRED